MIATSPRKPRLLFPLLAVVLGLAAVAAGCGGSDPPPSAAEREQRLAQRIAATLGADSTRCRTIPWGDGRHFTCVARLQGHPYWLGVALPEGRRRPLLTSVDCSRPQHRPAGIAVSCAVPGSVAAAFRRLEAPDAR